MSNAIILDEYAVRRNKLPNSNSKSITVPSLLLFDAGQCAKNCQDILKNARGKFPYNFIRSTEKSKRRGNGHSH